MNSFQVERIFLVRHAESEGNVDKTVHLSVPDHAIALSPNGVLQAKMAAEFLRDFYLRAGHSFTTTCLWSSPYKRTRQTARAFAHALSFSVANQAESILLCEQQFGLFDGVPDEELPTKFPLEHAHYKKCEDFEGRFWSRVPLGESRFDVAVRVHQVFGTLIRNAELHRAKNIVIVSHGVTIRAFRMMWMDRPWEWVEEEKNPNNCQIDLLEFSKDVWQERTIFDGFPKS